MGWRCWPVRSSLQNFSIHFNLPRQRPGLRQCPVPSENRYCWTGGLSRRSGLRKPRCETLDIPGGRCARDLPTPRATAVCFGPGRQTDPVQAQAARASRVAHAELGDDARLRLGSSISGRSILRESGGKTESKTLHVTAIDMLTLSPTNHANVGKYAIRVWVKDIHAVP